jgi:hypothetical protein
MRSDVNSAYTYFANTTLPKIVGPTKWRGQVTKRTISQIATPTDEAFGLLLLENSWENWIEAGRLVHEDNSKSGANKTPFIYSLRQTKGGSRKFEVGPMLECAATGNWYTWSEPTEKTLQTKTASRLVTRPTM